jgi:predicted CoA-binding protein
VEPWHERLIEDEAGATRILRASRRVAVLGIKPESRAGRPAHYVPAFLQQVGYDIVPVPVYYPDVTRILGRPVYRSVAAVPGALDLLVVFRRAEHIAAHLDDILAKKPAAVWFQSGIRNDAAARKLAEAGIEVVQDRCAMVQARRAGIVRVPSSPEATGGGGG